MWKSAITHVVDRSPEPYKGPFQARECPHPLSARSARSRSRAHGAGPAAARPGGTRPASGGDTALRFEEARQRKARTRQSMPAIRSGLLSVSLPPLFPFPPPAPASPAGRNARFGLKLRAGGGGTEAEAALGRAVGLGRAAALSPHPAPSALPRPRNRKNRSGAGAAARMRAVLLSSSPRPHTAAFSPSTPSGRRRGARLAGNGEEEEGREAGRKEPGRQ